MRDGKAKIINFLIACSKKNHGKINTYESRKRKHIYIRLRNEKQSDNCN